MARPRRTFTRAGGKRTSLWLAGGIPGVAVSASSSTLLGTLNAAALALRPFTIVRTRILIHFNSDQTGAAEFTQAVYSEQVVTDSASAAGIASVPTPITEANADFHVYQPLFQKFIFISGVGVQQTGHEQTFMVDSKAMRKVGIDDDLVSVVELRSATGAEISVEGRILIKLH